VRIGLNCSLKDFGLSKADIPELAKQSMILPDYSNNPKVPTPAQMTDIITAAL